MTTDPLPIPTSPAPNAKTPIGGETVARAVGAPPVWSDSTRRNHFEQWLTQVGTRHALVPQSLRLASADASFRRYFRVDVSTQHPSSLIIMDAPPTLEDAKPFVRIAELFAQAQVLTPQVLEWQEELGFLLLSDLGDQTLMQSFDLPTQAAYSDLDNTVSLPNEQTRQLFSLALDALLAWQLSSRAGVLPDYDEALLRRELSLFDQWYVVAHKGLANSPEVQSWSDILEPHYALIVKHNLSTPKVFVHRDFMTRNLMMPPNELRLAFWTFKTASTGPSLMTLPA